MKNQGEKVLKKLDIQLQESKNAHEKELEVIKNNHIETFEQNKNIHEENMDKFQKEHEAGKDERQKKFDLEKLKLEKEFEERMLEKKIKLQQLEKENTNKMEPRPQNFGMNFNPYFQYMTPNNPNPFNNCYPIKNQTNYNNAPFNDGTPGPLPGQNMNMNQMSFYPPPLFFNSYNMQYPQKMQGFNSMENYSQFNNCYQNPNFANNNPYNVMNPNMNSYQMTNPSTSKMV